MNNYPEKPEVGQTWRFIGWINEDPIMFRIISITSSVPDYYSGQAMDLNTKEIKSIIMNSYKDKEYMFSNWVYIPEKVIQPISRLELITNE